MSTPIRVLLVDDHAVVRQGMRRLLNRDGFEVVGEASNGSEALRAVAEHSPDVLVLDLQMPVMDGLAVMHELKAKAAGTCILVLTSFADDQSVLEAIRLGAQGYLLKDALPIQLLQAIQDVHRGQSVLDPDIAMLLMNELRQPEPRPAASTLTERETQVLLLVAAGMTNQAIAQSLVISDRTVAGHIRSILGKLNLASRTQAALYAVRNGLAA